MIEGTGGQLLQSVGQSESIAPGAAVNSPGFLSRCLALRFRCVGLFFQQGITELSDSLAEPAPLTPMLNVAAFEMAGGGVNASYGGAPGA